MILFATPWMEMSGGGGGGGGGGCVCVCVRVCVCACVWERQVMFINPISISLKLPILTFSPLFEKQHISS